MLLHGQAEHRDRRCVLLVGAGPPTGFEFTARVSRGRFDLGGCVSDPRDVSLAAELVKASPPVLITTASKIMGLTLADWIAVLTILYLVLQIGLLVPKYWSGVPKLFRRIGSGFASLFRRRS